MLYKCQALTLVNMITELLMRRQLVYLSGVLCVSFHCSYLGLVEVFWVFAFPSQRLWMPLQQVTLKTVADVVVEKWEKFVNSE